MIVVNDYINTSTIVVFSSLAGEHVDNINPQEFLRSLKDYEVKLVFVSDNSKTWYRNGIDDSNGFDDTVDILKSIISGKSLFMGHSAGAYAAILFGSIIGVDNVLAFSPQMISDTSWRGFIPHPDLLEIVRDSTCNILIVYCNKYINDFNHIKPFVRYVGTHNMDCDKHNSAKYARDNGFLRKYIKNFVMSSGADL